MRWLPLNLILLSVQAAYCTVNVYFSPSTSTLQNDFISMTTSQYIASVTPDPYFTNTFKMTISGKRAYTPPVVSSPIADATAVDRCMSYGFGEGMETERADTLNLVYDYSVQLSSTATCGGIVASTSMATIQNAYLWGCYQGYQNIYSTVTRKNTGDPPGLK